MKKTLTMVLVGALLLIPTGSAHASWRSRTCRFNDLSKLNWTHREVKKTIFCVANHYNDVSLHTAMYVAERESGFYFHATNPSSGTCGIYQHMPQYWAGRVSATPNHWHVTSNCYNARSNIVTALYMVHVNGWGPWAL